MKDQVITLIMEIKKGVTIDENTNLIFDGVLSSLEIIQMIVEIENKFGVKVPVEDVLPDNFNTVDAIVQLLKRLKA